MITVNKSKKWRGRSTGGAAGVGEPAQSESECLAVGVSTSAQSELADMLTPIKTLQGLHKDPPYNPPEGGMTEEPMKRRPATIPWSFKFNKVRMREVDWKRWYLLNYAGVRLSDADVVERDALIGKYWPGDRGVGSLEGLSL